MDNISKSFSLLLIVLLVASSLILAKPAFAQTPTPTPSSTPTPSVPVFTVQPVGPPIIVNTTYYLDPNTGKIVAQIGYTNEYSAVNITIKNQIFSNLGGNTFYYNVQWKPHDSAINWFVLYALAEMDYPTQSNSEYTVLSISTAYLSQSFNAYNISIANGAEIDIQVEALIGTIRTVGGFPEGTEFYGQTSGWSSIQTVTLPANVPLSSTSTPSSSPTSTLTPTPTQTSTSVSSALNSSPFLIALIVIAFLLAIIIFLLIYMRKRKPINSSHQTVSNGGT